MKPTLGLAAAFVSCVAASQPTADVYILPNREATSTPSVSSSVARLITLQRLASFGQGPSINDIPSDVEIGKVASLMNEFGKPIPALFDEPTDEPSQLVIVLEGLTEQQIKETRRQLDVQPAFTVPDVPPADPLHWLTDVDLSSVKVTNQRKCTLDEIINPFEERCWTGSSLIAEYDVQKKPEILANLIDRFPRLTSLAKIGEMQTTLILLPIVSESLGGSKQGSAQQELRRRQAERVISSFHDTLPVAPTSAVAKNIFRAPSGPIPACFDSLDSCISNTGNCSQQGQCLDKYGSTDAGSSVCFACHCLSTRTKDDGPLTHWAGPTCSKKDISVPFWLFAGFTLLMLGTLSLAVTMLYNVGEEKLPGVIGAGVSKSK